MRRIFEYSIIAASIIIIAACATTQSNYVICNDMAPNVTCPDNTANVIVSM
jgi:hypothetical protein